MYFIKKTNSTLFQMIYGVDVYKHTTINPSNVLKYANTKQQQNNSLILKEQDLADRIFLILENLGNYVY
ncbi:hypothetical protein [Dokdonia sp.]|uniref:hypothetical protein n=1 Tax=Dokdonia sp. TaxID=2024995 RepID=UPI0032657F7C